MIHDHDRSGWFGASDTDRIMGNWNTKTFEKWWCEKIGLERNHFTNESMLAGTHFEHRILDFAAPLAEKDKQILLPNLRLRVNLDGNTESTIYEVKTYRFEKGFKVPMKYKRQVWVQMYATGIREAYIIAYGLEEKDYKNFLSPIDKNRLSVFKIEYDEAFIQEYLRRLKILAECLRKGVFPVDNQRERSGAYGIIPAAC